MADADVKSEARPETSGANVEELLQQLSSAQSLAEERLDLLMRCRADLDNVMKRSAREKEDNVKYASEKLVCKLLPVLDSLEQRQSMTKAARCSTCSCSIYCRGRGSCP